MALANLDTAENTVDERSATGSLLHQGVALSRLTLDMTSIHSAVHRLSVCVQHADPPDALTPPANPQQCKGDRSRCDRNLPH
ncbi:Os01g0874200 [Oryza sativa Japonica Group]|uniref:Os01g0874200 protein n=1 Tax=Oryza sativa subsp. japonica TaxID=39947 RepID=A0A0P0VB01_ORYSJ|nr:Os01g0874200 [Oryza sativa Japonica Group]